MNFLSIIFDLGAKRNVVTELCIINQDDASVTEIWLYRCLCVFYISLYFQLFLICNLVNRVSPLKHSANLQKQKEEYTRFTSQSLGE